MFQEALGFSDYDLSANQHGEMSSTQRWAFLSRRDAFVIRGIVFGIGCLIFWYGGHGLELLLILAGIAVVVCAFKAYYQHVDAKRARVGVVEGRIKLNIDGLSYSIMIDNHQFNLKQKVFLAFKNGDPYRIYYGPTTRIVLSAEWLRD